MRAFFSRHRGPFLVSVFGLAGLVWGLSSAPGSAHACECTPDEWTYRLEAVEAPEGARDHSAYWPAAVRLSAYEGTGVLWAIGRGPETLDRISAKNPREDAK